jgi:glycosyltransferase involved in cell wall biosynthesis
MANNSSITTSIALCTYNGEKYLKEQLKSIINQTVQPDEIIICDDCSKDNSVKIANEILTEWNGAWKVCVNENNLGYKKNFQKAISLCHGDIIFLSDQDDVWNLHKLELMLPAFENHEVVLAFHDAELVDEKLNLLYPSFWETMNFTSNQIKANDYRLIFSHNIMQGAACCFRKGLFKLATPFPEEAVHDEWLLLMGLANGKVIPVSQKLLLYRQAHNVIGGMPVSFFQKTKKWYNNLKKGYHKHRLYLNNRDTVFKQLIKTNRNSNNNDFSIQANMFEHFLERRLNFMNHISTQISKKEYDSWYFLDEAKKQWLKDWITYFLDKG